MAHAAARHPSVVRGIRTLVLACALIGASLRPVVAQPDLMEILSAVVAVEARVPDDARTSVFLGDERLGTGIVIDGAGLVVTIGYLILEATDAWIRTGGGQRVPADILAYDHETGFGLLRAQDALSTRWCRWPSAIPMHSSRAPPRSSRRSAGPPLCSP